MNKSITLKVLVVLNFFALGLIGNSPEVRAQVLVSPTMPKLKPVVPKDGDVLLTASPTSLPVYVSRLPGDKPNPPAPVAKNSGLTFGQENGLTAWVMPSLKYQAEKEEVGTPGSMICNVTFDDGPHPKYDPQILDILDRYNARATFYVVGQNVKRFPETTRLIVARGHEIGNHSWKHDNLKKVSRGNMAKDLARTNAEIRSVIGSTPIVFRPPYGNHTPNVLAEARGLGMETLLWTVDSLDWKRSSPSVTTNRVLSNTKPGAVILLHSIHRQTVEALPAIMDGLVRKGCRFVTSSEWIAAVSG